MSQSSASVARRAGRSASPWVQRAARLGYAVKGLLYLMVGFLAVQVAVGNGGAVAGQQGAIREVGTLPAGGVLMWAVAAGLIAYALWMVVEALVDPDRGGAGRRLGSAISAVVHGGLAWAAIRLAMHAPVQSEGQAGRTWTAHLLSQPFGAQLVGGIGIAISLYGLWQIARSIAGRLHDLEHAAVPSDARPWTMRLGRVGQAARGFVFAIAGSFLVIAAVRSDPREARGLGQVLSSLTEQPLGYALLFVVAAGLLAYGIYMLVMARYRRVSTAF